MMQDIERVLVTEEELHRRIREMGAQLTAEYAGKNPLVVGILRGVVPFYAEMALAIRTPCQWDFLSVSSYAGTESTGTLTFRKDLDIDIRDRHVLILEDILDSGRTLKYIRELLLERGPASLKICTLLDKPSGRTVELEVDYTCFTIPGAFVVGYGLDYDDYYRNLPFVGVLKPSVYEK
ncbi:MAG: hypoxanthine phosphoribosyltransferase [Oscillospiraceae bacterium]|nr:hypoxanthine phosphoribosyltransferase [Oscillospiraceae bacterium]